MCANMEPYTNAVKVDGITVRKDYCERLVKYGTDFDNYRLHKDDVLIACYPRTGTTWLSQIISLLRAGHMNLEEESKTLLFRRVIYIEHEVKGRPPEIDSLDKQTPPRLVKTHLPYNFVNRWVERDGVKTIVTLRNPKDTLVSYYHFHQANAQLGQFKGSWSEFLDILKAGNLYLGDQLHWCQTWSKVKENPNVLFIKYEDMISDLSKEVQKIITFLNIDISDQTIKTILKNVTFDAMKSDPSVNLSHVPKETYDSGAAKFIRKGKVGEWKNYFTVEQNQWFDETYRQEYHELGLGVYYE